MATTSFLRGVENYNKDVTAARLQAEWDVTDTFDLRFSADWLLDKSDPKQGHRLIPSLQTGAPVLDDVYDTRAGLAQPAQRSEAYGGSLVAHVGVRATTGRSRTSSPIARMKSSTPIDFDSLPAIDVDVPAIYENDQFSEELQFLYSSDKLNGLIGVYYLDANALTGFRRRARHHRRDHRRSGPQRADLRRRQHQDLVGVRRLHLRLHRRPAPVARRPLHGRQARRQSSCAARSPAATRRCSAARPCRSRPRRTSTARTSFTDFSPRVSLAWDAAEDHNLYFTYAKGFKGGGFDPRGQTSAAPDVDRDGVREPDEIFDFMQFEPETVNSYEVGWKGTFERGRFTTNLAAFWMDYSDVQVPSSIGVDTNGDGINDTFTGATTNAAAATLKGVEFDGNAVLGEDWITKGDELTHHALARLHRRQVRRVHRPDGRRCRQPARLPEHAGMDVQLARQLHDAVHAGEHDGDLTLDQLALLSQRTRASSRARCRCSTRKPTRSGT